MNGKITDYLLSIAEKISANRYMIAIRDGFAATMPVIMTGAFSVLFINLICSTTTKGISLAKVSGMGWLSTLSPMFEAANYATTNCLTIIAVIAISISLGKYYQQNDTSIPLVALASYISLCSTNVFVKVAEEKVEVIDVLSKQFTSSTGLFLGMFTAIVATELYIQLSKSKKFEIKMPDSVPSSISKAFASLFPAVITIMLLSGFGLFFKTLTGVTISDGISMAIQKPLTGIVTGLPGILFIFFLTQLLWVFGIHGTNVLSPVYVPVLIAALNENLEAASIGAEIPNIISRSFSMCYLIPTGSGLTGGLIIAILLFSKREDYRAIAKLSAPAGLFNVNEPVIFGLPIVLNPLIAIPFLITPVVSGLFAYFMTYIGFAGRLAYPIPWTTPIGFGAFIASGGNIGAAITQVLCLVISTLIYLPFILISNKAANNQ